MKTALKPNSFQSLFLLLNPTFCRIEDSTNFKMTEESQFIENETKQLLNACNEKEVKEAMNFIVQLSLYTMVFF